MIRILFLCAAAACAMVSVPARAESRAQVVSTGKRFDLKKVLKPEGTTVFLFIQDSSAMEQQFLTDLEARLPNTDQLALRVVRLATTQAPAAQQLQVTMTPTVLVFDRFGKELARTAQPDEIRAAVRKGLLMGRIFWYDEDHERAPEVYGVPAEALKGRTLPGIVKTMALRPEAFRIFNGFSQIHFTSGFLARREHELIGAYVSSLNKCRF